MTEFQFESQSEEDTIRLGQALAAALPAGAIVALNGTLGAGKTRLVQAVAEALGIDRHEVVSPTFVLLQEHHGEKSIFHVDAYRIRDDDEFMQLGMDEYFAAGGLVFIEWAERVASSLPPGYFMVAIDVSSETSRTMTISSSDQGGDETISQLRLLLNS